ncbi:hydroxyisourate hydrolase [Paenibacillus sp. FSL H8-0548]|uniref:hydroxyisourate hydrolase n=1 Tax=Paenibacillus sp. FSL H8-0548 TaxID=1920422 RepID=UPI00096CC395|nr:hydroxyisourate hydrolase [Paenibacillus sp. FSL H8-0548]OMF24857.1 hydroxyisourate hydrolase [Paenibacillus sp. FSL H8-0548]
MSGRITTHVLDLAGGRPVVGITIELWYLGEEAGTPDSEPLTRLIGAYQTNSDGRVEQPMLEGEDVQLGVYELIFAAGDFFRRANHLAALPVSMFDLIPIRFYIRDASKHYHVPLLVAPGGYSTYRGS